MRDPSNLKNTVGATNLDKDRPYAEQDGGVTR